MANTSSAPANATRTGLPGMRGTWWPSRRARSCRPDRPGRRVVRPASGVLVWQRVDQTLPERPFEVAVRVEPQLLEPRPLRLLCWPTEQLAEVVDGRGELAVRWQRRQVYIGLGAGDSFVVEARQPDGDRLDLVVEPIVGHRAVDVSVPLGAGS